MINALIHMDNSEEDSLAWMDWVRHRRRCQAHRSPTEEGTMEKRLMHGVLFFVVTAVTCAVTTVCVLQCWRSGDVGEDLMWNGANGEVLNMVGKEIDIQLNRFKSDLHFTLQTSSGIEEKGEGNLSGWRNAYYSLQADREYVAPSTAYYMIYTCLSFLAPPSEGDVTYWQELWRHSHGDDKKLMVDAQNERCDNSLQSGTEMSFCHRSIIVVVLKLKVNDHIYVRTSHRDLVGRRNGTSYFAVLKMS